MSQPSMAERAPLSAWQVASLRLTVFPDPMALLKTESWWHDIIGENPESSTSQPRRKASVHEGTVVGGRLILGVEPARIDWRMVPPESRELEPDPLSNIGVLPDVLSSFQSLMGRWFDLESYPKVKRLAFGAVKFQPVSNRQSGYQQISTYLPFSLDTEHSSDFLYRINRPRSSTSVTHNLLINRLSTWSVLTRLISQVSIGVYTAQYSVANITHACGLELDINTDPEYSRDFSTKESHAVFDELVLLDVEIAREGDIP